MRKMAKNNPNLSTDQLNKIVDNTVITGDVTSATNIRVDGKIAGTLSVEGKLVLGTSGTIEGEVNCTTAEIEGTITGNITVRGLLSLKSTTVINGDIRAEKISMEPGAVYNGKISMSSTIVASTPD